MLFSHNLQAQTTGILHFLKVLVRAKMVHFLGNNHVHNKVIPELAVQGLEAKNSCADLLENYSQVNGHHGDKPVKAKNIMFGQSYTEYQHVDHDVQPNCMVVAFLLLLQK